MIEDIWDYYSDMIMVSPMPAQNKEIPLPQLLPGQCAVVRRVESESEEIQRLKTLGLCVGRRVEVVRAGDPLIIKIFGSRIGISASLASRVWLELCSPDHCALKNPAAP